jgi:aryl-alcohol dehydrogenase-like predicted oxidoreductase
VLTKTWARDPATARADLDRFRKEMGTDYLDICLMHCVTEADWPERFKGVRDVLSEAKEKGIIRAHGCSCHSIEALRAAAKSPWVEVDLVRVNPIGSHMDADPNTVVSVIREMRAAGKAVVGMKILGQGDMSSRQPSPSGLRAKPSRKICFAASRLRNPRQKVNANRRIPLPFPAGNAVCCLSYCLLSSVAVVGTEAVTSPLGSVFRLTVPSSFSSLANTLSWSTSLAPSSDSSPFTIPSANS